MRIVSQFRTGKTVVNSKQIRWNVVFPEPSFQQLEIGGGFSEYRF